MSTGPKIVITHVRPPEGTTAPVPPASATPAAAVPGAPKPPTPAPGGGALPPMPKLGPLEETLARFAGKRAYLSHPRQDHGDHLASLGAQAALEGAGVGLTGSAEKADVLVVGSGSMADDFKGGFEPIESFARKYPVKPLVVLPSSFHLHAADVARVFMSRIEPAYVYAREEHSLQVLESLMIPWPVSIGLDHDVTFHLGNTELFHRLLSERSERHVLIVERREPAAKRPAPEMPAAQDQPFSLGGGRIEVRTVGVVPGLGATEPAPGGNEEGDGPEDKPRGVLGRLSGVAKKFVPHRWPPEAAQTPFAKSGIERVTAELPKLKELPVYADDVADPAVCSFGRFLTFVAGAAAVVTDRVSVAVLASMLDKPVWVRPGTYHKTRGVFRYSLAMRKSVRLI